MCRPRRRELGCRLATLLGALAPSAAAQEGADDSPPAQGPEDVGPPAPEHVVALTLEDALQLALEQNLDLEMEELSSEIARFEALGSWGAFDPVIALTPRWTEQEIQGTSSLAGGDVVETDSLQLDASLSVPFVTGGRFDLTFSHSNDRTTNRFAAFDVSTTDIVTAALTQPLLRGAWPRYATTLQRQEEIEFSRQRQREAEVRHLLVLDVYQAYWDLVSATEELEVRRLAVELGERQLGQDRRRLEVGSGTEVDVLQAETNVAQQTEALIQAQQALRAAEDSLRRMLFQKPDTGVETFLESWDVALDPLTPLPGLRELELDWRRSLALALELRPELMQRRLDVEVAEVALTGARSQRLPQLDLEVATSGIGFAADPDDAFDTAIGYDFPSSSAALVFSLPIHNRAARYAVRAARVALRQAQLGYDRQELDVLAEVRAAVRDVAHGAEAVLAAEKAATLARRQLEAEVARQEIGLSTTFQVLEFQQDLAEALSAASSAQAEYAKALARLAFAEGTIDATPPLTTTAERRAAGG